MERGLGPGGDGNRKRAGERPGANGNGAGERHGANGKRVQQREHKEHHKKKPRIAVCLDCLHCGTLSMNVGKQS